MRAWLWLVPVTVVIALASPASRAGEGQAPGTIAVVTEAPVVLASTLRADLKGATVGQVFRLLDQALGGKAQFIVNPGARDVPVPAVTLKDTDALGLMNLIANLVPDLWIRVGLGSEFQDLGAVISMVRDYGSPGEVFKESGSRTQIVLVDLASEDRSGSAIDRKLRIYRLADMKVIVDKGMTVDDLATTIESVWEVEPIPHVATLKYHKETNLLICFGTPRHLALVDQVIEGVSGRVPEAARGERLADLEKDVEKLRAAVGTLQAQNGNQLKTLQAQATLIESLQRQVQVLEALAKPAAAAPAGPK